MGLGTSASQSDHDSVAADYEAANLEINSDVHRALHQQAPDLSRQLTQYARIARLHRRMVTVERKLDEILALLKDKPDA